MADGTGKVDAGSDLLRKSWFAEGLVQKAATSFWAPYKGTTMDSVIIVKNDIAAGKGTTVIFDFDGNLSGKAIKGNNTAKGKGEQKKKFSDSLVVSDYRYVVDNGTKFNGVEIGDLSINEHSDSRSKLADLIVRADDQAYFDLAQQNAEFGITLTTASLDEMLEVEEVIKNGTGFTTSPVGISTRLPLAPFRLQNGEAVWLWLIDASFKRKMLSSTGMQTMLQTADLRGNENRLLRGVLGKIGNFVFIEAGVFFGTTTGSIITDGYYNYDNNEVEIAGMRKYDTVNGKWSGEEGYDASETLKARSVILGSGAFQKANGMMPNYEVEFTDFKKFSESCAEVWCAAKSTKLFAENSDNKTAKVAGYNWGSVFVDIEL